MMMTMTLKGEWYVIRKCALFRFVQCALFRVLFPPPCSEPDELLAHIDDMLADLNTELDFMIPGTDV